VESSRSRASVRVIPLKLRRERLCDARGWPSPAQDRANSAKAQKHQQPGRWLWDASGYIEDWSTGEHPLAADIAKVAATVSPRKLKVATHQDATRVVDDALVGAEGICRSEGEVVVSFLEPYGPERHAERLFEWRRE
jgi:hypothetical protein